MGHSWKFFSIDSEPAKHYARCACGHKTPDRVMKHLVGDDTLRHEHAVERLRLQLGTRTPSLKSQRDHFEEMAANEGLPEADRVLWKRLADEITARLNDRETSTVVQDPLF